MGDRKLFCAYGVKVLFIKQFLLCVGLLIGLAGIRYERG